MVKKVNILWFLNFSSRSKCLNLIKINTYLPLKGQSHEMFKVIFNCGLIGLGQERNR
jgi:hypothetical protein